MDFGENLGKLTIEVDQSTVDLMTSVKNAAQEIAEAHAEAGLSNDQMLSTTKQLYQTYMSLNMAIEAHRNIDAELVSNAKVMLEHYKEMAYIQEKTSKSEHEITEQKKAQTEESKKAKEYMALIQRGGTDPIGTAGGMLQSLPMPGWAKALVAGGVIIAKEGMAAGAQAQDIERTAGLQDEISGSAMARLYGQARRASGNALFAPDVYAETYGRGYATKEQFTGGAATLYGFGGGNLRADQGGALADIMPGLTKSAYYAGGNIQEFAPGLAKVNRVFDMSASELETSFEKMAFAASESGENSKEFATFLMDAATATEAYGGTIDGVNLIVSENYRLIREEKMTREEMVSTMKLGKRMGLGDEEINGFIGRLGKYAENTGQKVSDLEPAALSLEKAFVSISHSSHKAFSDAGATVGKFSEALKKDISEATLTNMVNYLVAGVGMTRKEMESYASYFVSLGKHVQVSSDKIAVWHEQMTTGTKEMFDDPKEAAWVAGSSLKNTAKMFDEGRVSVNDWNTIIHTQMDVLGDTGSGATSKFAKLATIVETTNTRMSELSVWTEQLSRVNRQYGFDQTASTNILVGFTQGLRDGMISLADIQSVMKGPAGASEATKGLLVSQLASSGGALGKAFSKTGVLGGIDILLPDLMTYLGSGNESDWTPALRKAFGTGPMGESERTAMQGQVGGAFRGLVKTTMQGPGGSDIESADFLAAYKRLSVALFGSETTAVGKELDKLVKLRFGALSPEEFAAGVTRPDKEKSEKDMVRAYGEFKKSSTTISTAATIMKEAATIQKEAAIKGSWVTNFLSKKVSKLYGNTVSGGSEHSPDEGKTPWITE